MRTNAGTPEERLEKYEELLGSANSYLKELKAMTAKHGTESSQFEEDLMEVEYNIKYYEHEIAELKEATEKPAKAAPPSTGTDTVLPHTAKQGIGSLIISSISFVAGAFLGSKLKSRRAGKGGPEEKR
jgi:hypothetical protein